MEPIDLQKTTDVDVNELEFDFNNPRLYSELADLEPGEKPTVVELIKFLHEEADLGELITSILTNGYIKVEPLIVLSDNDKYRVLEGNRRLAAVRLLLDEDLRNACGFTVKNDDLTKEILESLEKIPVYRVEREEDARALIGFKHIKGPYKWNSFAKAQYVTLQFKEGKSIEDISKAIGDKNATVRNLVCGVLVLDQALEADLFEISDRSKPGLFGFSHLYTALGRSEYQDFLGLEAGWSRNPGIEPVAKERLGNLAEVLSYIYGSKKGQKAALVQSQNPDLKDLGKVLCEDEGLAELRSGSTLSLALDMIRPDQEVFDESIRNAYKAVNQALANVTRYDGEDARAADLTNKTYRGAGALKTTVEIARKGYLEQQPEEPSE